MRKRFLSHVLTFTMAVSLFSGMTVPVSAADDISNTHNHGEYDATTTITSPITAGSYSLSNDISIITDAIRVNSGIVNICLNGKKLEADVIVGSGATLNIYDCSSVTHAYQSSTTGAWALNADGNRMVKGGVLTGKIKVEGTFHFCGGTLCGVSDGVAISNKGTTTIGKDAAVMGNYNGSNFSDFEENPVIFNGQGAEFYNYGHIDQNVALLHTVLNRGGTFCNYGTINGNYSTIKNGTNDGLAAGGVANYGTAVSSDGAVKSVFYNYGEINKNTSNRSSGGVLNKVGEFYNYGEINENIATRHCGGVDNTSKIDDYTNSNHTFFKNYGQINENRALGEHEDAWGNVGGGDGGGIYNEKTAQIYNYGQICGNKAKVSGAGIYFTTGDLYVGEDSKVTGNTVNDGSTSNILLGSGKLIQMDKDNPLTKGASMGVHLTKEKVDGQVTSGYNTYSGVAADTYFFPDSDSQLALMKADKEVYLIKKTITVEIADWDYGDEPNEPVVKTISGDDVDVKSENCFYKLTSAGEDTYSNVVPEAPGKYTLKVVVGEAVGFDNFEIRTKEIVDDDNVDKNVSSRPKKYTVTVEDAENGTVESSRTKASKGKTVTLTTDPAEGYEVKGIVVETKEGKEVEVTDKGEGRFTFKMPAANVIVSVDFAKAAVSDDVQVEEYILLTIDSVIAWVFDEYVANDVPPVIRNERTMLPARFVAEALGGVVTWDEADQKVTIVKGKDTIEIFIGEPFATVNGTPVELDCAAYIENGRTYLPIRFIAENMGATVTWDAAEKTVKIVPSKSHRIVFIIE